ncbi:MAG: hypothetical protein H7Y42_02420 [Chitinophagaceae bacterium]|nr:hypothetical protein [Chitinophagaceae bacterium]
MDLRDTILEEHSKAQTARIVKWIGNNQSRFDELFKIFLNDEYRVVQRAAWPLSECVVDHPALINKHFTKLLQNLRKPGHHDAVKRNTVRLLQFVTIPKKFHGDLMDLCFTYIADPKEKVGVKAFALTVLGNLCDAYPEIRNEIKLLIEDRWEHETAAFRVRARQFM